MSALTLGAALLAVAGCGLHHAATATPSPSEEGRQSYLRSCASGHGVDGTGGGPVVPALVVAPPDLTRLAERHAGQFPRDYVIAVIAGERDIAAHGRREMPVWSERFEPSGSGATAVASIHARRRLQMLADYLESLQAR